MNILMLNYEFPPLGGGASPVSYEIAKGYVRCGHRVDVVTMQYKGLKEFEVVDGIYVYRVRCLRSKKEICHPWEMLTYIWAASFFLSKHLNSATYDMNHTHFVIPTGAVSLWLKKKFNIPYIITSHGSDIPGYNADRFKLLHLFTGPLLRKILNHCSGAYTGSRYLANLGNSIRADIRYQVIREGFDSFKYQPQDKKKLIFSSGRLLERKGFQFLIQAVSEENIGYEVHICGDGPMRGELEKIAKKSRTKVVLHGWLDNTSEQYKNLLEQASIYVLVSERENASVSLMEAMSAGCAVITSNVSGCPETVGDAGITVSPGSVEQVHRAIQQLLGKETEYGKKARKRIVDCYNWDQTIQEYETALKSSRT